MALQPDKICPMCHSEKISMKYYIAAGRAYECKNCVHMWGWYYDRNKQENRLKSDPDS